MADQTFQVNSGFYDSINQDRLYSADEMNKPYKRLISNGVYATPQGTPSTDLQVQSASNGMNIIVKAGQGIFADKWFESTSDIPITVPSNSNIVPRMDSVIVQIDKRQSGRVGSIVYREGTPASNALPPNINTIDNVIEYRLANIYVASNANAINNDAITDLRGSANCPWITSLIYQVDISQLFNQYQNAYEQYYENSTAEFEEYEQNRKDAWDAFVQTLTDDLTVTTNVVKLTNTYVSNSTVSNVPIGIPSYSYLSDILLVFVNGLQQTEGVNYTLASNHSSIDLKVALKSGQTVTFVVFKSVITGDVETVEQLIQNLNSTINTITQDSGWVNFTLESGATSYDSTTTPGVRKIGDRVYLRGSFKGVTTVGSTICTLPTAYRPAQNHVFMTGAIGNTTVNDYIAMVVQTNGSVKILASSGSIASGNRISLATDFVVG